MAFVDSLRTAHSRWLADKNNAGYRDSDIVEHLVNFCSLKVGAARAIVKIAKCDGALWDCIEKACSMTVGKSNKPLIGSQYPFVETSGVPEKVQIQLLTQVLSLEIPNMDLFRLGCKKYKGLKRLRQKIIELCNVSNWVTVKAKYPALAHEDFISAFLHTAMSLKKNQDFDASFVLNVLEKVKDAKRKRSKH